MKLVNVLKTEYRTS